MRRRPGPSRSPGRTQPARRSARTCTSRPGEAGQLELSPVDARGDARDPLEEPAERGGILVADRVTDRVDGLGGYARAAALRPPRGRAARTRSARTRSPGRSGA